LRAQRRRNRWHLRCPGLRFALHDLQLRALRERERPDRCRAGSPTHPRSNRADGAVQRGRRRGVLPRPGHQLPVWLSALCFNIWLVIWTDRRSFSKATEIYM